MKILLLTVDKPASDRTCWSGIPFSIKQEMDKYFEVDCYCLNKRASLPAGIRTIIVRHVLHKYVSVHMQKAFGRKEAKKVQKVIEESQCDAVLALKLTTGSVLTYLKTDKPIIYFSDCVAQDLVDYYWHNVGPAMLKEINYIQKAALDRSDAVILTSQWARDGALREYGTDDGKIHVLPFGANVEITNFVQKPHDDYNLLFVGIGWDRKGADIAIDCVEALNRMDPGHRYYLHLVGSVPPKEIRSDFVKIYGFLNRNNPEEQALLEELRAAADFFILPTKAECAGIVFCEACAYGIPSITFDTGGIPDYVINGYNGYRMPPGSSGEQFAKKILEFASDPETLRQMKQNSRLLYKEKLNWQNTGYAIKEIIEDLCKQ